MRSYKYIAMFFIILALLLLVEFIYKPSLEGNIKASEPNIKNFEIFLVQFLLVMAGITVIVKGLLSRSERLLNSKLILSLLKNNLVIYFLMVCISTLVFSIIGWGILVNQFLDRAFLINTIILCLIIFVVYELIVKTIIRIRDQ